MIKDHFNVSYFLQFPEKKNDDLLDLIVTIFWKMKSYLS